MKIRDIDKKLEFLKSALHGGSILRGVYQAKGEIDELNKAINYDKKIIQEIKDLESRKIMIMRSDKIKKILNG